MQKLDEVENGVCVIDVFLAAQELAEQLCQVERALQNYVDDDGFGHFAYLLLHLSGQVAAEVVSELDFDGLGQKVVDLKPELVAALHEQREQRLQRVLFDLVADLRRQVEVFRGFRTQHFPQLFLRQVQKRLLQLIQVQL